MGNMKTQIRFNKKLNKFEGLIGEKVVSRASTKLAVQRVMLSKYNIHDVADGSDVGEGPAVTKSKESMFKVDERFQFIDQFVQLIARKKVTSLVVSGPGGLGKTYQVEQSLKSRGLKELTIGKDRGDYVVFKGYSTAKYMYRQLFDNNGMIIVFDDCDSVLKDPIGINILKGALDSNPERVITWGAEFSKDEELPNRFKFTGQVIFISNLAIDKIPQTIISRAVRVDLAMTTEEKVDRIATVMMSAEFEPTLKATVAEKKEVLEFIRKNATKFTDLNIRSAVNIMKIRMGLEKDWERLALYMAMS
jgi:hypothetical protein